MEMTDTDKQRVKDICQKLIPIIQDKARQIGWAVSVHGSMTRDLDLIAVPWIEEAHPELELVEIVRKSMIEVLGHQASVGKTKTGDIIPFAKPHGRRSYTITSTSDKLVENELGAHPYIDLCVVGNICSHDTKPTPADIAAVKDIVETLDIRWWDFDSHNEAIAQAHARGRLTSYKQGD